MKTGRILGIIAMTVATVVVASYAQQPQAQAQDGPAEPLQEKPLQLALVPQVQLVPEEDGIKGLRLEIYGSNERMTGVDIGLMHETKGEFSGVGFGLLNFAHGDCRGLQFGGIYNGADGRGAGLQLGIVNTSGDFHGVQIGLANIANDMTGIQIGLWNEIKSKEQWRVVPLFNAAF